MFIWLPQNDFETFPTNLGSQDPLYDILSSSDNVIQSVDDWEKGIFMCYNVLNMTLGDNSSEITSGWQAVAICSPTVNSRA